MSHQQIILQIGESHNYFSDDDHTYTPYLSQEETVAEAYNETYDGICNEHNDDSLVGLLPCDLFSEEDDYDHEEGYSHGCDTNEEDSLISDIDGGDDYWNFIDNPTCENLIENSIYAISSEGSVYSEICGSPIYDISIEGSMDLETWENPSKE